MWIQLLQLTHGLSHQEMNTEWCSYSKKAPEIQWNTLENSLRQEK